MTTTWGNKLTFIPKEQMRETDEFIHNEYYMVKGSKTTFTFQYGLNKKGHNRFRFWVSLFDVWKGLREREDEH